VRHGRTTGGAKRTTIMDRARLGRMGVARVGRIGPARLRIAVTLAALPDGDDLSFTRLQELIGLTPGNLITHLRKLEDAGYVTTYKNGSGVTARTSVALTHSGRAALEHYTTVLRQLLDSAEKP
jgi:DNA-binding MarR family transcriptional regulator